MKKNYTLIVLIALLVGVLAYLKYNKSKTNFEEVSFHIPDVKEIGAIQITDKHGMKTILSRKDSKWMVNDSFYAEDAKMLILLQTLNKLQIEFPIGDSMRSNAIQDLRTLGREVKITDLEGKELKTIFIGSQMGSGNNMILSRNDIVSPDPYIVKTPGIKTTDLKHRFPANPEAWYSTEIFSTSIDKIKKITLHFHDNPKYSFVLTKDEDLVKINPIIDSVKIDKPLNQERVVQFLLEFESKHFEGRIKQDSVVSYIKLAKPAYTIEIEDVLNEKRYVKLYRIPSTFANMELGGSALDATGQKLPYNIEKYWSYSSYTRDYAIAQHYVFGPVLMPYYYFFESKK